MYFMMNHYVIALMLLNLYCSSLGVPVPVKVVDLLIDIANNCENTFLKEQIKGKLKECNNPIAPSNDEHQMQCLMFYEINSRLCSASKSNKIKLIEYNLSKKINEFQDVTKLCNAAQDWMYPNISAFVEYKSMFKFVFNHTNRCITLCSRNDLMSDDSNFFCKYYKWGTDLLNATNSNGNLVNQSDKTSIPHVSSTEDKTEKHEQHQESRSSTLQTLPSSSPKADEVINVNELNKKNVNQKDTTTKSEVSGSENENVAKLDPQDPKSTSSKQTNMDVIDLNSNVNVIPQVSSKIADLNKQPKLKEIQEEIVNKGDKELNNMTKTKKLENFDKDDINKENQLFKIQDVEPKSSIEVPNLKPPEEQNEYPDSEEGIQEIQGVDDERDPLLSDLDSKLHQDQIKNPIKNEDTPVSSFYGDEVQKEYSMPDAFVEEDDHFFSFFLTAIILIIVLYILYHNKSKVSKVVLGLIVEGRQSGRRRNSRGHAYRRLDTLEQAMSTNTATPPSKIIY